MAENRDWKAYIENLKQHIQEQQFQFLEKQKNYYHYKKATPKKYKKVACEEESESEPESEEIEKPREIKKASSKEESTNNIFDYINEKNAKRYKQ